MNAVWMCIIYQNEQQSLLNQLIMVICHHITVTWHKMAVSSAVTRDNVIGKWFAKEFELRYEHAATTSLPWVVTLNPHNSSQQTAVTEGRCEIDGFERLKGYRQCICPRLAPKLQQYNHWPLTSWRVRQKQRQSRAFSAKVLVLDGHFAISPHIYNICVISHNNLYGGF